MSRNSIIGGSLVFYLILFFFCQAATGGQANDDRVEILSHPRMISGYNRYISGQKFNYHSMIPDVKKSLLVRATDGKMKIEWETAPVPADVQTDQVQFVWIAGLGCNLGQKNFTLFVQDKPLFTFASWNKDHWELSGANGARLRFSGGKKDPVGDVFGYMVLTLKKDSVQPGQPVRLKVVGEKANSQAWYMTFRHPVQPFVGLVTQPVLIRKQGRVLQQLKLEMMYLAQPQTATVYAGDQRRKTSLEFGYNAITFSVNAISKEEEVPVRIEMAGQTWFEDSLTFRPVKKMKIYLLHHTHLDIGYTHTQEHVMNLQWQHLNKAIELAQKTQDYPPEARFKWLPEGLWAVDEFLQQASQEEKERFIQAVRNGWIGLDAMYGNELTALCRPEELLELVACARRLQKKYGFDIESAMISDVPGWTWGLVPALARSGVKYLSLGPNSGHRIGYIFKMADKPFYWQSPSGEEKVLCWIHGKGYSWFHTGTSYFLEGKLEKNKLTDGRLFDYLRELDESGYPYDMVPVRYNIGSDNGPPDPLLPDIVKNWNEKYESPKLIIATPTETFREFEKRYGTTLPVLSGDLTPYWEDGAASTAQATAMNRAAAERLVQAGTLWALLNPAPFPAEQFIRAWKRAILYDEHTWGAWNSISEPDADFVKQQWAWKEQQALVADSLSRQLLSDAVRLHASTDKPVEAVDVFNTTSWLRTDVVILPVDLKVIGDFIVDDKGHAVPSQRLAGGELAFVAENVPGTGAKRFFFHSSGKSAGAGVKINAERMENDYISLHIDPVTGTISSLKMKGQDFDLVDVGDGRGLNDYVYVNGRDPKNIQKIDGAVRIAIKEQGPVIGAIEITSSAPGCNSLSREIRLIAGLPRVDIIDRLDKKAVRTPEGVHIAFPFKVPDGEMKIDTPWAVVRPEKDQLPGACKNWFTVQRWVDIANEDYGVTWATVDAPLVEIGDIRADATVCGWLEHIEPSQKLYSYVMNNYWETNYKADQSGEVTFRYAIQPHLKADPADPHRFGIETSQPLIAVPVSTKRQLVSPLLSVTPETVLLSLVKPTQDKKAWIVRLFNTDEKDARVRLTFLPGNSRVFMSNLFEEKGAEIKNGIDMPGYALRTLRIEPQ